MRKIFSDIWKSRNLIAIWTQYKIEATYLEAKLGILWIVLQPVLLTLIYAAVFGFILERKPRQDVPFVLFFLSGMVLWQFFSNSLMKSTGLMASKINLVSQVKFPRESLVIVEFCVNVVDWVVTFFVLLILNAFYGYYPTILYAYLMILMVTFFSFTMGAMFILATVGVFIQDTSQIVSLVLRFLMYFSGVIISADMLPEAASKLLMFNPLFFMIESFRNIVLYAELPNMVAMIAWLVIGVILLFGGFLFFKANDGRFADYQ